jgi:hypothetical protein
MPELKILLDLGWEEDGEEWLGYLYTLIRPGNENVFGGTDESLFDQIEITVGDPRLHSVLVAQRTDAGRILCTVCDDDPPQDGDLPDQITPWREAALEAARLVGTVYPPARWNAVLGPCPHPRFGESGRGGGSRPVALAAETKLGPLLLVPGGRRMHEMTPDPGYLVGDRRRPFTSSPVIVEGEAVSYGEVPDAPPALWPMDDLGALRVLHRAAALLSLAWDEHWVVRAEPVRVAPGERVEVPHLAFGSPGEPSPWARGCEQAHAHGEEQQRVLPDWTPAAWDALERAPALSGGLAAFAEALAVGVEHPSVAALLLVTVIEGIGAWRTGTTRAMENFRTALGTVLPPDQVTATARAVYERRSRTAHSGALHGPEAALGFMADSSFRIDPAEVFVQDELSALYDTARNVLIHALTHPVVPGGS